MGLTTLNCHPCGFYAAMCLELTKRFMTVLKPTNATKWPKVNRSPSNLRCTSILIKRPTSWAKTQIANSIISMLCYPISIHFPALHPYLWDASVGSTSPSGRTKAFEAAGRPMTHTERPTFHWNAQLRNAKIFSTGQAWGFCIEYYANQKFRIELILETTCPKWLPHPSESPGKDLCIGSSMLLTTMLGLVPQPSKKSAEFLSTHGQTIVNPIDIYWWHI